MVFLQVRRRSGNAAQRQCHVMLGKGIAMTMRIVLEALFVEVATVEWIIRHPIVTGTEDQIAV